MPSGFSLSSSVITWRQGASRWKSLNLTPCPTSKASNGTFPRSRRAGVEIHLDDFGTGYSSLSYLHKLPIDALKIDQSFVREMLENSDSRALVEAIAAMAHALRLTTIAEGVETQAQADLLAEMGVDYAQGYLYCKPCSIADFRQWTADRQ